MVTWVSDERETPNGLQDKQHHREYRLTPLVVDVVLGEDGCANRSKGQVLEYNEYGEEEGEENEQWDIEDSFTVLAYEDCRMANELTASSNLFPMEIEVQGQYNQQDNANGS